MRTLHQRGARQQIHEVGQYGEETHTYNLNFLQNVTFIREKNWQA